MDQQNEQNQRPHYRWPWFVLGAFVLAIILAVIWMTVLIQRTREQREMYSWPQAPVQTNAPARTNAHP